MATHPQTKPVRTPPSDVETEKALLGSILLRPEAVHDVIDILSAESFYARKHGIIFSAMFDIYKKGEPIDLVSLSSRLKELKEIETVGGMSYLTGLVDTVPSSMNAKHYAEIVQKKYTMRQLIEAAYHITELGFAEEEELEELLDKAEKQIYNITSAPGTKKFIPISDVLADAFERLDKLQKSSGTLRGVPTGFPELDNKIAGLQKADLVILAARPSMGKTSLALDIARHSSIRYGKSVGIFSLEMSAQQLVDRMLASEAQVDAWRLRTGKLSTDDEFERISDATNKLSQAKIFIDDQAGNNILKMRSVARRLKSEQGLDLIIVDYLQLMVPSGKNRQQDNMVQQVTEISRSLKQLARELDVPVVALSQLSRAIEQRRGRPQLSDLRDSGSIEQDADLVMFIHSEDRYKEAGERSNIVELIIAKHRNGPTGVLELYFDDKKATFRSLERHGVEQFDASAQGTSAEF
ncbi:replicative DNA helicase [Candidatus Campbellbacteria bacterium]|nr:MAG: replicative DNA helicase [Candidatus Campbellbacteria bacterium]